MPESFRTLEYTPPLRLTIADLAKLGEDLARQVEIGGRVSVEYDVSYRDGVSRSFSSPAEFQAEASKLEDPPMGVSINVNGWSALPEGQNYGAEIVRHVHVDARDFGTQFQVSSSDPNWGKGATQTLHEWFKRHSPWYGRFLKFVPGASGVSSAVPFLFVIVAWDHERAFTTVFWVVLGLSALLTAGNVWFWKLYAKRQVLPHTRITIETRKRDLKIILQAGVTIVAFVADLVTIVVVLTR